MNIGIIGGGFAGMTAAYELGKLGHKTVIFERMTELGSHARKPAADDANVHVASCK